MIFHLHSVEKVNHVLKKIRIRVGNLLQGFFTSSLKELIPGLPSLQFSKGDPLAGSGSALAGHYVSEHWYCYP